MQISTPAAGKSARPFIGVGLPRSRTAWLSRFLTYGEWTCGHEEIRHFRSLDDARSWFSQPCNGTVETAGAGFWRLLPKLAPDAKIVVIRRPAKEVIDSLLAIPGVVFDRPSLTKGMIALDRKLDQIEARLPCLSVSYADLAKEETCASIFEYCLPYKHDPQHWSSLDASNIQMDMRAAVKLTRAFQPQMAKLAAVAKHRMLADLASRRPVLPDGITIQSEGFDEWLADAAHLLNEHLTQIGEAPTDWQRKNIPLLRLLDEHGHMQIMTARSNGRLFGYLMTFLTPSLTAVGKVTATNGTFFASSDAPGLGIKLQRAALRELKARGVDEVLFEASLRGSGPKLGTLYKRLGAVDHGHTYRLDLAEAA
jgi:hypothetical protein